jgi:hypothetical protein
MAAAALACTVTVCAVAASQLMSWRCSEHWCLALSLPFGRAVRHFHPVQLPSSNNAHTALKQTKASGCAGCCYCCQQIESSSNPQAALT